MSTRILAAALGVALLLAYSNVGGGSDWNILHVFFWLVALTLVMAVALWPTTGRDQQVDLKLERMNWADHVDIPPAKPAPNRAGDAKARTLQNV